MIYAYAAGSGSGVEAPESGFVAEYLTVKVLVVGLSVIVYQPAAAGA